MEFVLLIVDHQGAPFPDDALRAEMGRYAAELRAEGKLCGGTPLQPEAEGVRVAVREGRAVVTDGPFAECKEVIGGFAVVSAASREEAVEIAKRCPHVRRGIVEVREAPDRDVVADAGPGPRFVLLMQMPPDLADPDGACYRAMVAYDGVLKKEGSYVESSQLSIDPPRTRVATQGGKVLVTDGPFAEAKEVAGGYYVVRAANLAEAVEIAKRCPHARNGVVEVRKEYSAAR